MLAKINLQYGFLLCCLLLFFNITQVQSQSDSNNNTCVYPIYTDMKSAKNVLGGELATCCTAPMTGYYRTGSCQTGPEDLGTHIVCAIMTEEFLAYTKAQGNDLSIPMPLYSFPGLKPGDKWCLCISRWIQAKEAGVAPKIDLSATHISALNYLPLQELKAYAIETSK